MKKKIISKLEIESELIKDFSGIFKNRSIKLNLRAKAGIELFVSKKTGCIIPEKYYDSSKNLEGWQGRYKNIYSSRSPHFLSRHTYTIETSKEILKLKKKNIADLGCGNGGLISLMSKSDRDNNYFGFEASKENVIKNKKNFRSKSTKIIHSSIEDIDQKKYQNFFDVIFMTWTLSSSSKPLSIMKKIKQITKKNKYLIIAESSRILVPPVYIMEHYFNYGKKPSTFLNYPWRFSFNSLRNLLLLFDFEIIHTNNYVHNENMVIVAKKSEKIKKNYKIDNYKRVISFFNNWKKYSKLFKNFN